MVWIGLHGVMFLFLFSDFYKQNYIEKQKRLKEAKRIAENGKVHSNDDNNSSQMVSSRGDICSDDNDYDDDVLVRIFLVYFHYFACDKTKSRCRMTK